MSPEQLKQEIQLIFARACAESLKESVSYILRDDLKEEKARAHGEAFASAFVFMSRYFTGGAKCSLVEQGHTSPLSSSSSTGPQ